MPDYACDVHGPILTRASFIELAVETRTIGASATATPSRRLSELYLVSLLEERV
ncbi:MAG: hypothetical protein AVDCRST_MAG93-5065 [uncultured Chloroflexia bacterium]|uniref:Uncharacterized protein n=1 Tax=uncultured Chloroflexia bacterium TaxID=1672391 RepID=A0A6J4KK56_9CHLR|nr:MAG: hypothetical protein AVDCRST_MAG93-5065 [uncultured Chloroflexia bacterium]